MRVAGLEPRLLLAADLLTGFPLSPPVDAIAGDLIVAAEGEGKMGSIHGMKLEDVNGTVTTIGSDVASQFAMSTASG